MVCYGYGFASFLEKRPNIDYMLVTAPLLFILCAVIYHIPIKVLKFMRNTFSYTFPPRMYHKLPSVC